MKLNHLKQNQSGGALMNALILISIVAVTSSIVLKNAQQSDKSSHAPRIKSEMLSIESRIRYAALQSNTYSCTGDPLETCQQGATCNRVCTVTAGTLENLNSDPATYAIQNTSFNNNILHTEVHYIRNDFPIRDLVLDIQVPGDVLMGETAVCTDAEPLFKGFNPTTGHVICAAIPNNPCGVGQYVSGVNSQTLALECRNLPSLSCPANQVVTRMYWQNDSFAVECGPRQEPLAYYHFTPSLTFTPACTWGANPGGNSTTCPNGTVRTRICTPTGTCPNWNCHWSPASCPASPPPTLPSCGTAHESVYATAPTSNLCASGSSLNGSVSPISGVGWGWTCTRSSSNISCFAYNNTATTTTTSSTTTTTAPPPSCYWHGRHIMEGDGPNIHKTSANENLSCSLHSNYHPYDSCSFGTRPPGHCPSAKPSLTAPYTPCDPARNHDMIYYETRWAQLGCDVAYDDEFICECN